MISPVNTVKVKTQPKPPTNLYYREEYQSNIQFDKKHNSVSLLSFLVISQTWTGFTKNNQPSRLKTDKYPKYVIIATKILPNNQNTITSVCS